MTPLGHVQTEPFEVAQEARRAVAGEDPGTPPTQATAKKSARRPLRANGLELP